MEKLVAEHQARLQANRDAVAKARERFEVWRTKKQAEEQRIYDAIAPFVSENPVSTVSHSGSAGSGRRNRQKTGLERAWSESYPYDILRSQGWKPRSLYVESFLANGAFFCRLLHLGCGKSGSDPGAELSAT